MDLFGKVVIITGASEGIGAATVKAFADKGSRVVLAARNESALRKLSREIDTDYSLVVPTDITRPDEINELINKTVDYFQKIDILINNAGVGLPGKISDLNICDFLYALKVNTLGPLDIMQKTVPVMVQNGGGIIVNVLSMVNRLISVGSGGYRATKMALEAISDSARLELKKHNIRIFSVYPGLTSTRFQKNSIGSTASPLLFQPRGRSPEFVAKKIVNGIRTNSWNIYMGIEGRLGSYLYRICPSVIDRINDIRKRRTKFMHCCFCFFLNSLL
ncbi:MAG TPA: SDR family NAD(P)-dependent oxidoreductase [Chitinispirillaceae bacterium]|nr:SDR family NAD(P)-dependent oxidoreductase [Chitinispirillaceae bacterium]